MKISALIISLFAVFTAFSQKKIIDHTSYKEWKRFEFSGLSALGNFTFYTVKPLSGDGYVCWVNTVTGKRDSVQRAFAPKFASDESFLALRKSAGFDTLRSMDLAKTAKDKWIKDTLVVQSLMKDSAVFQFAKLDRFEVSKEGGWIAFTVFETEKKAALVKKKWWQRKKTPVVAPKTDGKTLTILQPCTGKKIVVKGVTSFLFDPKGYRIAVATHFKNKEADSIQFQMIELFNDNSYKSKEVFTGLTGFAFTIDGTTLAGLSSKDTNENKQYELFTFETKSKTFDKIADTGFGENTISENGELVFSHDKTRLYYGIAPAPKQKQKDTLIESEKVKLDLWSHTDPLIQTQQLFQLDSKLKETNLSVYTLATKTRVVLEDEKFRINELSDHGNGKFVLARDASPYEKAYNYKSPYNADYFLVNTEDGTKQTLKMNLYGDAWLSPSGGEFIYVDSLKMELHSLNTRTKEDLCMTCGTKAVWFNDVNGMPTMPDPVGIIGWFKTEKQVLLHSENDIWAYDYTTKKLKNLTEDTDPQDDMRFRFERWATDSTYLKLNEAFIVGFNKKTRAESMYNLMYHEDHIDIMKAYQVNEAITFWKKATAGNRVLFSTSSVAKYPDLYATDVNFSAITKYTNLNPQQVDYNWSTVEHVKWTTPKGQALEGLMYKPENFDATKSYPMLVYFYELYSDEIHNYYAPKPSASIINPVEYASAGYLVFIPDIRYNEVGHPAKSAYECIVSGTDAMLKQFPNIDSKRLGLQGQSWGGYQTAQLITMTDKYAAAMAGAPVSNMVSAYGGIRWGSGINRQFQYERTQSRIGKTLWEARELYIENSPIFHLDKVHTPLLIMSNDKDGAVPWYQGIELYMGLRRLNQPVWMLNYNGDDHNLMQNANRMDLSIRMRQFFDHYLLDKPATQWMLEGIPATVKGKELRY